MKKICLILKKRTGQIDFAKNEEQQHTDYWPSADYIRSRTVFGSKNRGVKFLGKDKGSEGSRLIIEMVDKKDQRPVWVLAWGGSNTLAQALLQVKQNRSKKQVEEFIQKIRFYAITDQDRDQ